jgi:hypothetical protein
MRKITFIQITILILTLATILSALFFSFLNTTIVSKHEELATGQMELILWNLKSGQKVTGSFLYSVTTTSFRIVNPDMGEIYFSSVVNGHGSFVFLADIDGLYRLYVPSIMQSFTLDYKYTISTPILGLDLTTFIGLVITIGIILELIVFLINRLLLRKLHYEKILVKSERDKFGYPITQLGSAVRSRFLICQAAKANVITVSSWRPSGAP